MSNYARPIRDTLSNLQGISDYYSKHSNEAEDLPEAFHGVAKFLPPAQDALQSIKACIDKKATDSSPVADALALDKEATYEIRGKTSRLYDIFSEVMPPTNRSRRDRYQQKAKGEGVEVLMMGILRGIRGIAQEPVVSREQITALEKALDEVSKIPRSLEEDRSAHSFYNYGSGPQSVQLGDGDQNVNSGPGVQFNHGHYHSGVNLPGFHPPK